MSSLRFFYEDFDDDFDDIICAGEQDYIKYCLA